MERLCTNNGQISIPPFFKYCPYGRHYAITFDPHNDLVPISIPMSRVKNGGSERWGTFLTIPWLLSANVRIQTEICLSRKCGFFSICYIIYLLVCIFV